MAHPSLPLFAFPPMVKDLVRGFIMRNSPEVDNLDYDHMTRIPDDWVPDGPRYADMVWSIPFLPDLPDLPDLAETDDESNEPTHIILIIKFASEVIQDVGERLGRHAASLHREINRRKVFGAPVKPPVIAPIVVYDGTPPWDAPGGIAV